MRRARRYILEWGQITLGTLVLSLGINLFLVPNRISSGGITTVGTVLLYLFGIRIAVTNFVLNAGLFFLGLRILGRRAVLKTGGGILLLSLFLELTSHMPVYTEDLLLASLAGGVAVGVGVGLVVRREASTGGSDFAALILRRFLPHLSIADTILWMDLAVILLSGAVFGSVTVTGYSVLSMYITAKVTDAIVTAGHAAKEMRIFSRNAQEIAREVMARMARGVTAIHCTGMYSGHEGRMLLCVVSAKELPILAELVHGLDPEAFVVIGDAREVRGKGFLH